VYVSSVFLHSSPLPQFLPILTIFRPAVLTIIHSLADIDAHSKTCPPTVALGASYSDSNARGKNKSALVTPEHVVPQIIDVVELLLEERQGHR
jgi:hypothetical protein